MVDFKIILIFALLGGRWIKNMYVCMTTAAAVLRIYDIIQSIITRLV